MERLKIFKLFSYLSCSKECKKFFPLVYLSLFTIEGSYYLFYHPSSSSLSWKTYHLHTLLADDLVISLPWSFWFSFAYVVTQLHRHLNSLNEFRLTFGQSHARYWVSRIELKLWNQIDHFWASMSLTYEVLRSYRRLRYHNRWLPQDDFLLGFYCNWS